MHWPLRSALLAFFILATGTTAAWGETAPPSAGINAIFFVSATDSAFEDRVEIRWSSASTISVFFRILRDGVPLTVLSSQDSAYSDTSGVSGVQYSYCVQMLRASDQQLLDSGCDPGNRILFPAENLAASDQLFDAHVRLAWTDASRVEAGYHVYRTTLANGSPQTLAVVLPLDLIATTGPDVAGLLDTTAVAGVHYQYCVRAFEEEGIESAPICDAGMRAFVNPPLAVSATDGQFADRVVLTWTDQATGEARYEILRDGQPLAAVPANGTRYVDEAPVAGTTHTYCVRTVNQDGQSSVDGCDTGGAGILAAPGSITASDGAFDDRVDVSWEHAASTHSGFRLYRQGSGDPSPVLVTTLSAGARSFTDSDAAPGVASQYCIEALSDSGGVSARTCDAGSRALVSPPTGVTAGDGTSEDRVVIRWSSAATRAVLYRIYRDGIAFATVAANRRSAEDFAAVPGQSHLYCVTAVTADEVESALACDAGSRVIQPPVDVVASDDEFEDRTVVRWRDRSHVETGFRVLRYEAGVTDSLELGSVGPNQERFTDTTGKSGLQYDYRVYAVDLLGRSVSRGDAGRRTLLPPAGVQASDGGNEDRIIVTWRDDSRVETAYRIYRRAPSSPDSTLVAPALPANSTSFIDTPLAPGARFIYSVAAIDGAGEHSSFIGDEGATELLAPESVNASDTYTANIVVTWVDQSARESGYEVRRDGVLRQTLAANVTTYTDVGAATGPVYEYCVRAIAAGVASESVCDDGRRVSTSTAAVADLVAEPLEVPGDPFPEPGSQAGAAVGAGEGFVLVGEPGLEWSEDGGISSSDGVVRVYNRGTTTFDYAARLKAPTHSIYRFGGSLAVSGERVAVGATRFPLDDLFEGAVVLFDFDGETWEAGSVLRGGSSFGSYPHGEAPVAAFGTSVALDGNDLMVGTAVAEDDHDNTGSVNFYQRQGASWTLLTHFRVDTPFPGEFEPPNHLGRSVALDGDLAAAGAPARSDGRGRVYALRRSSGQEWSSVNLPGDQGATSDSMGFAVAVSGNVLVASAPNANSGAGTVWVWTFVNPTTATGPVAITVPGTQKLGRSLAFDGELLVVGADRASGEEGAFVFVRSGDTWARVANVRRPPGTNLPANSDFGGAVALHGGVAVLGDETGRLGSGTLMGHAFVVQLTAPPRDVVASDGAFPNRVEVRWADRSTLEDEYRLYRDGERIATLPPNSTGYDDFEAEPGRIYRYCVAAFDADLGESLSDCDLGRRNPNGFIGGRITTLAGAGVEGVEVCLDPPTSSSLLFDGSASLEATPAVTTFLSSFTVEFWVRSSDVTQSDVQLLSYQAGSPSLAVTSQPQAGTFRVALGGSVIPVARSLHTGAWRHVAIVLSGGTRLVYVDGVLVTSQAGSAQLDAGGSLRVGATLRGQMDDVRLWSAARAADEVASARTLRLEGDEQGLLAYYPLDEGTGTQASDVTSNARYASLVGGAYWSGDTAPVSSCGVTDIEGNYTLAGIRYGESTTFRVQPSLGVHRFDPAYKTITLSTGNPVQNEVAFIDASAFTISGRIQYGTTGCGAASVEVVVDGIVRATTESDGSYLVAAGLGTHTVQPRRAGHTFLPAQREVVVGNGDLPGRDFDDLTRRTLSGRAVGGCDRYIGDVTLRIQSETSCLNQVLTAAPLYELRLPPQSYFVSFESVSNVPAGLDPFEIATYLRNLGPRVVDLTAEDTQLDFQYRAPMTVVIAGFPEVDCSALGVPILDQGKRLPLTIRAFERYGDGDCPVDSGIVTITDEILDIEGAPVEIPLRNGVATYTTIANTPNVFAGRVDGQGNRRDYQKALTAVVEAEGLTPVVQTHWVLVTGRRPRTGSFVAVSQGIPIHILHDPPGDGSSSFLEEGESRCVEISEAHMGLGSTGVTFQVKAGVKFEAGSPFWSTDTEAGIKSGLKFDVGVRGTDTGATRICVTTRERISTSNDERFIGGDSDVFVGVSLNILFAKSDEVAVENCRVVTSQSIAIGGPSRDPFASTFLFTEDHIRNGEIPQLRELAEHSTRREFFTSAADNWQSILDRNDRNKRDSEFERNLSVAAGASYEFSTTTDTTARSIHEIDVFANLEVSLGFGFEVAGSGVSSQWVNKIEYEYQSITDTGTTHGITTGYTLSDNDRGDFFSVNVKRDPAYGTPVFDMVSGTSSCPWEPWKDAAGAFVSRKRDQARLQITPVGNVLDVAPDDVARFILTLANASETDEVRGYYLQLVEASNPGGATLLVGGTFLTQLPYFLAPNESHSLELNVRRGPNRYAYDDLTLRLVPICQWEEYLAGGALQLASEVVFDVGFRAPCTDISLDTPESGWVVRKSSPPTLPLRVSGYDLLEQTLASVLLEYRLAGEPQWTPIATIARPQLDAHETVNWTPPTVDGEYEIRAATSCTGRGTNHSLVSMGTVDRKPPRPLGQPQPSDGVLAFGEDISVTFDETILCSSVTDATVQVRVLDPAVPADTVVSATLTCDGRKVVVTPQAERLALLEGRRLRVRVGGILDRAGNPLETATGETSIAWEFVVRQNAFAWAEQSITRIVPFRRPGSIVTKLSNGTLQSRTFEIRNVPTSWLGTPTPSAGTLIPGEVVDVVFPIQPDVAIGVLAGEPRAVVLEGGTPVITSALSITIDVRCVAPDWSPLAAGFENSMTIVAEVASPDTTGDRLAAYVGNQLRGAASPQRVNALNRTLYFLTVLGNRSGGETVRFEFYDGAGCLVYGATNRTVPFVADGTAGTPTAPIALAPSQQAPSGVQAIAVSQGWTWVSLNRASATDMSVNGVLASLNPASGDVIKSQTQFASFEPAAGWTGTLSTVNTSSGYQLRLAEPGQISHEGAAVDPATTPVPLAVGWNLIGYTPDFPLCVDNAFASISPKEGDLIKAQDGFAQYVAGNVRRWIGNLREMEPGRAYRLLLASGSTPTGRPNSFFYPATDDAPCPPLGSQPVPLAGTPAGRIEGARDGGSGAGSPGWNVDPHAFQYSMTITGVVRREQAPLAGSGHLVAAFVGGELRGVAPLQYVDPLGRAYAFLMVHGDELDHAAVELRFWDAGLDQVFAIQQTLAFEPDRVLGSLGAPAEWDVTDSPIEIEMGPPIAFELRQNFPNPPDRAGTTVEFAIPNEQHVALKLYDLSGREVKSLVDGVRPAGRHRVPIETRDLATGVYMYRLTAGSFTRTHKMAIVR